MTLKTFPHQPAGGAPLLERLTWDTDIQTARSGGEHRRCMRSRPRYSYEFSLDLSDELTNGHAGVLADLRSYRGDWLLPLWVHASGTSAKPTRGVDASGLCLAFYPDGQAVEVLDVVPPSVADVVPAAPGRIVEALRIAHTHHKLASVSVSLELANHAEVVAPFETNADGALVFDFPADWSNGAEENLKDDENRLDYGGLWAVESRYRVRTFSLNVYLHSEAEIARYRQFLFAVQGAYRPFLANPGVDEQASQWRLNSDTVEILYEAPGLAISKITLKQL